LLGNPPILLLDEADANLDAQASSVIDHVLAAHTGTVLLITHRRERVAKADMVWFLEDGQLLEEGVPEQLLSSSGPTARFFAPRLASVKNTSTALAAL
jgi:ATP-binding cassette subfamily B protein/subfamily B ATP-binding cassette protein MsbA